MSDGGRLRTLTRLSQSRIKKGLSFSLYKSLPTQGTSSIFQDSRSQYLPTYKAFAIRGPPNSNTHSALHAHNAYITFAIWTSTALASPPPSADACATVAPSAQITYNLQGWHTDIIDVNGFIDNAQQAIDSSTPYNYSSKSSLLPWNRRQTLSRPQRLRMG